MLIECEKKFSSWRAKECIIDNKQFYYGGIFIENEI